MSAVMSSLSTDNAWRELHEAATVPYKKGGTFAWQFARGKLGRDPVFRGPARARADRCAASARGRHRLRTGLFVSLLASMSAMQQQGRWPASWPATPAAADYTGIELMPKDVARAEASVGHLQPTPRLVCADMCSAALPDCDLVVILDVLHYVDLEAQEGVLARVRDALRRGGNPKARCCCVWAMHRAAVVSRSANGSIAR
jgi:hypothetical protein